MGFGVSLFIAALGAVLAFAVSDRINGVDLVAVGWILMAVGLLGIILSAVFWSSWGGFGSRRTTVVERDRTVI
jgi:hypothetical protein